MTETKDFHIAVTEVGPTVRARLEGALDAASLPAFLEALEPLAPEAEVVRLDCSDLDFCDSAGLGGFVRVRNAVGAAGRLVLDGPTDGLRQLLTITGLTVLLDEGDQPGGQPASDQPGA
jgi:anti-anti-sigma factor